MEPFYNLLPTSSHHRPSSPHANLSVLNLQAVTSEWLSLTLDPSASTASPSLPGTPIPPTPPPLPDDFTPLLKAQEPKATQAAPLPRGFALPPRPVSGRSTPSYKEGTQGLDHIPAAPPYSKPPTPSLSRPFTSPLPDSSPHYNSGTRLNITETTQPLNQAKTEVSPAEGPQWQKSIAQVDKNTQPPVIKQQGGDPYDELLSMILDGPKTTGHDEVLRLSPVDLPPITTTSECPNSLRLEAEKPHQPAVKLPASESASSLQLEVEFHKPVTMEPLSITWDGQSKTEDKESVESRKLPSVKGKGHLELFIEEDEDVVGDRVENVRNLNERLDPQADAWPTTFPRLAHLSLSSPATQPPLPSSPSPPPPPFSPSQQHERPTISPSPTSSPPPPTPPLLTTSPLPQISSRPVSPALTLHHPTPKPVSHEPISHLSSLPPSSPRLPHPVPSCHDSEPPLPLPLPSRPLSSSPPLTTPSPPPTLPHPEPRSPKVKRFVHDAPHGAGDPYQALYNYLPRNEDELELKEGDVVDVMEKCDDGWFVGTSRRSKLFGTFPGNYVKQL